MLEITSRQNKNFKIWRDCLETSGIQTHHRAILAGKKVIHDLLQRDPDRIIALLMPMEKTQVPSGVSDEKCYSVKKDLFEELDIFGTHSPLAVIRVPQLPNLTEQLVLEFKGCVLWLTLQDPRNLGAILRSAAGLGVSKIVLGAGCAHPYHPLSLRTSSGAALLHSFYKSMGEGFEALPSVGLDLEGKSIKNFNFPKNFFLVPGVEGQGLSKNTVFTERITLPMDKKIESYNVTVATAMALYEWARQNLSSEVLFNSKPSLF